MADNFYCQNKCGRQDFSIDEWNQKFNAALHANLNEEQTANVLGENKGPCLTQCFECMAVVGETRLKNSNL